MKQKLKNQNQKNPIQKINKIVLVFFILSLIFFFISMYYRVYNTGYNGGIEKCQQVINDYVNQTYYSVYIPDSSLFNKTINNIDVFSDINDFSRINNIMTKENINSFKYPKLRAIIYYQNQSNYNGYYEHMTEQSCDGSFDPVGKVVNLYKCDGSLIIRNVNISSKNSESFILLHELGHYMDYNNQEYQQEQADKYAISALR